MGWGWAAAEVWGLAEEAGWAQAAEEESEPDLAVVGWAAAVGWGLEVAEGRGWAELEEREARAMEGLG